MQSGGLLKCYLVLHTNCTTASVLLFNPTRTSGALKFLVTGWYQSCIIIFQHVFFHCLTASWRKALAEPWWRWQQQEQHLVCSGKKNKNPGRITLNSVVSLQAMACKFCLGQDLPHLFLVNLNFVKMQETQSDPVAWGQSWVFGWAWQ